MPARILLLLVAVLPTGLLAAETVTIAVASNFAQTADLLAAEFSNQSGVRVRTSSGSTGKLYAQIKNGAPFDVFLAADSERPLLLEQSGYVVDGTRITYAIGRLALWSRDEKLRGRDCREVLQRGDYDRLALANPRTAPYGRAAREFLVDAGLWETASQHAVFGENIVQALQFAATGNASLGLVASSQIGHPNLPAPSCVWMVPESLHGSLDQQLVLLQRAANNEAARRFVEFIGTQEARELIGRRGYGVPR